jgi:excisionase family DNA binding protein
LLSDPCAPVLLTIEETARLLSCGTTLIKVMIRTRRIRIVKVGRLTRIPRAEVEGVVDGAISLSSPRSVAVVGIKRAPTEVNRRGRRGAPR